MQHVILNATSTFVRCLWLLMAFKIDLATGLLYWWSFSLDNKQMARKLGLF